MTRDVGDCAAIVARPGDAVQVPSEALAILQGMTRDATHLPAADRPRAHSVHLLPLVRGDGGGALTP